MPEDEFKISDLREVLLRERNSKQLTEIPEGFYRRLREYLNELEDEIEEVGFPSDSRSKALHREYSRAKNYAEDLFSRRSQKVALASVHHVAGSKKVNTSSMTTREEKLFYDIVALLEEMEEELFFGGYKRDVKPEKEKVSDEEVEKPGKTPEKTREKETSVDEVTDEGEMEDKEKRKENKEKGKADVSKPINESPIQEDDSIKDIDEIPSEILIHVIEKVPPFVDMDATYDLKKEDVVTLREDIANVLIKRGKARKIELD
ncbi:MAG: hypothetical protein R6W73_10060 [Candidatus Saliniplasma sp.]